MCMFNIVLESINDKLCGKYLFKYDLDSDLSWTVFINSLRINQCLLVTVLIMAFDKHISIQVINNCTFQCKFRFFL